MAYTGQVMTIKAGGLQIGSVQRKQLTLAVNPNIKQGKRNLKNNIACSAVAYPEQNEDTGRDNLSIDCSFQGRNINIRAQAGSGGALMSRSRVSKQQKSKGPKLDVGGGGGDIGKILSNGGDGGDDGGDDDDYYGGFGEGDEGPDDSNNFFRKLIPTLYTKEAIEAVLQEWGRTMADLPVLLREGASALYFSSSSLARYCAMDVRPNVARAVSRKLPPQMHRDFVGRMMADPAFFQKLVMESVFAAGSTLYYELNMRGRNMKQDFDQIIISVLGVTASTALASYMVAPNHSKLQYQLGWFKTLPNNLFDVSGPARRYNLTSRVGGLFLKTGELTAVGATAGLATSGLQRLSTFARRKMDPSYRPSVQTPGITRSTIGTGAYMGLLANPRYQLIQGLERYFFDHGKFLWPAVLFSGAIRLGNNRLGELVRPQFQGLPEFKPANWREVMRKKPKRVVRKVRKVRKVKRAVPAGETPAQAPSVDAPATTSAVPQIA